MMQEETTQKTISLVIKGGKINTDILKASIRYFLGQHQKHKAKQQAKSKEKQAAKNAPPRGKQSLNELTAQSGKLANIQVTEKNIGSFDRVARKYSIDYALKKDKSVSPPVYYVFFKAKDLVVMTAAFKEYSNNVTKKIPSFSAPEAYQGSFRGSKQQGKSEGTAQTQGAEPMTKAFRIDFKKYLFKLAPYLIFAYLGNKLAWLYRLSPGEQMLQKLMFAIGNIQYMFVSWLPSFYITDLIFGVLFVAAVRLALYLKSKNAKKYRPGSEYGSARWGNAKDIEPFIHPDFFQNIPLTQTERLTIQTRQIKKPRMRLT